MLTLAIGDLFIPDRSVGLPADFKKLLSPNPSSIPSNSKISQVLCLGNVTSSNETLEFLYNLSPSFHIVRGEFDDVPILTQQLNALGHREQTIPFHKVITIDNLRIGFTSGYQILPRGDDVALSTLARELDVDILIWGGTHKVEAYAVEGKFFINPGSATGAYTFSWADPEKDSDAEEEEEEEEKEEKEDQKEEETEPETEKETKEKEEKQDEATENKETETAEAKTTTEEENKETGAEEAKVETVPEEEKQNTKRDLFGDDTKEERTETVQESSHELDPEVLAKITELTSIIPSFCLLDSQGTAATLYIYTYLKGEVKVNKVTIPRNR